MKGKALILSEPFGGGHTKAAESLSLLLKGWNTSVYELGHYLQPRLSKHLVRGYLKTVEKASWVWGKIYSSPLSESNIIPFIYRRVYFAKLAALLIQTKPDIIIATHPFSAAAISSLKKRHIQIPLIGVTTDFHVHPCWSLSNWDVLCIASNEKPDWLRVREACSLTTGIPVSPVFHTRLPMAFSKSKLLFDATRPVVLWMGGSEGICKSISWVDRIKDEPSIQWIFVTGRNQQLYRTLTQSLGNLQHVRILGYTHSISELMDAADLLISKPGGVTCSEAIQKELPILLLKGITGQEEENHGFLVRHGLAQTADTHEVWEKIKQLILYSDQLNSTKMNMKRYKRSIRPHQLLTVAEAFISKGELGS